MTDYKNEVTLNEKDSIQDMLNAEKALTKIYATAITEGVSKGFRKTVCDNLNGAVEDQFKVFAFMTEQGYYQVQTAPREAVRETKEKFACVKSQLS